MPVILKSYDIDRWIQQKNHPAREAKDLLKPYSEKLAFHPVSTFVNSPKNNSELCIQSIEGLF